MGHYNQFVSSIQQPCRRTHGAFTLVEMVAAIVVLSILVGILVVATGDSRDRALQTRIQADLEAINAAKGFWALDNNGAEFPTTEADRFGAIRKYLEVSRTHNTLADFQPAGVNYTIHGLGQGATHAP